MLLPGRQVAVGLPPQPREKPPAERKDGEGHVVPTHSLLQG